MKTLVYALFALISIKAYTQNYTNKTSVLNKTERRVALVIGMNNYQTASRLKNPVNDAIDMSRALGKLGFEILLVENKNFAETQTIINTFIRNLQANDVVLFYFSGHGIGYLNDNYLLPIDASIECLEQISIYTVSVNRILADFQRKNVRNSFIFLDACRSLGNLYACNDTQKEVLNNKGFVFPQNQPKGSIIVFATQAGQTADDNQQSRNGLFTQELLKHITTPNITLGTILNKTAIGVVEQSQKMRKYQEPTIYGLLGREFYFVKTENYDPDSSSEIERLEAEKNALMSNSNLTSTSTKKFLELPFAEMVYIEGGEYLMGSNEGEKNEKPAHKVKVNSFWMGKYEITEKQWKEIMGVDPRTIRKCDKCAVTRVNWKDVQSFLTKLNNLTGGNYRLPTEEEWEYAAGGGSKNRTIFGNSKNIASPNGMHLNFEAEKNLAIDLSIRGEAIRVGSYPPNNLGLYDMTGNVEEFCDGGYFYYSEKKTKDKIQSAPTVIRGGCFGDTPQNSRITSRKPFFNQSDLTSNTGVGFRIVSN